MQRVDVRTAALQDGRAKPDAWTVPGSYEFLAALKDRDMKLYLASGTDLPFVRHEVELLGLASFFGAHIYGALDDHRNFSKKMIVEKIIRDNDLHGSELIGFGDGFVEIEELKRVGGAAVAVASDEVNRAGIHPWKRDRLVGAGADLVIADFRQREWLMEYLFAVPA